MAFKKSTQLRDQPRYSPLQLLAWGAGLTLVLLILFGIYSTFRRTAARVSADFYFPFLKAARMAENTVADQTLLIQDKSTLAKALQKLMKENAMLAAERTVVMDLKKENAQLRSLIGLERKGVFKPVFAEVLARDPMTWQEQFTIDKGSDDGIEPGNPVVTSTLIGDGTVPAVAVIGKISSVSRHTAQVCTILSQDFKMSVSLPESKSSGILEGARNASDMYSSLKFLPLNAIPSEGQLVYTNAFSGNSPPGLPVGVVVAHTGVAPSSSRNQVYFETDVRPFESPAEVRFVAVYVKEKK